MPQWWEVPDHLENKNGKLYMAGHDTTELAKHYGTPLHVLNVGRAKDNYVRFRDTMKNRINNHEVRVHYAMKANRNSELLKMLGHEGAFIDAVSTGEAQAALNCRYPRDKIRLTGTSMSDRGLACAFEMGIGITVDSPSQLRRLKAVLKKYDIDEYSISLRLDPGIRGAGHVAENITTGKIEICGEIVDSKFGIDKEEIVDNAKLAYDSSFEISGLHFHVGSNWRTREQIDAFLANLDATLEYAKKIRDITREDFEFLDVGGGPGVRYRESHPEFPLDYYAQAVAERLAGDNTFWAIAFEPGRYIVADAGILLASVVDVKRKGDTWIFGTDAGFNHLPRPELYNSHHHVSVANRLNDEPSVKGAIVGPVCENSDFLTRDPIKRDFPMLKEGDVIAFHTTGAYVKTMEMPNYCGLGSVEEAVILPDKSIPSYEN